MREDSVFLLAVFGAMTVITSATANPHHGDPALDPVITFLKSLRKARKHSGSGVFGSRDEDASSSGSLDGFNPSQGQGGSNPTVPILIPSGSGSGSSGQGSSSSSSGDRLPIQFPNFPNNQSPGASPETITRVNNGVSTILNGVRNFDLGQILRGAFIFPTNNNVKSVANNVIDSIFGTPGGSGGGGGGGSDSSDSGSGGDNYRNRYRS